MKNKNQINQIKTSSKAYGELKRVKNKVNYKNKNKEYLPMVK